MDYNWTKNESATMLEMSLPTVDIFNVLTTDLSVSRQQYFYLMFSFLVGLFRLVVEFSLYRLYMEYIFKISFVEYIIVTLSVSTLSMSMVGNEVFLF